MYEGVPNYPGNDRFWAIVEKYKVTKLYTAPTAIRTFMKWGAEEPAKHDLSQPAGHRLGRRADQPRGVDVVPRGDRRRPLPGRRHVVADRDRRDHDQPAPRGDDDQARFGDVPAAGSLRRGGRRGRQHGQRSAAATSPSPARGRGCCAASGATRERYQDTYWSRYPGRYFAGDGAKLDDDGYLWLLGRVDDVMNVSGHRISTTEVESALVSHPAVAEAAVVGAHDPTTGQAIIAYVTLRGGAEAGIDDLRNHVAGEIGAIAKPKTVYLTPDLPKTRSGKIMRRLLRDIAEGRNLGDTTTLADATVVDEIKRRATEAPPED